MARGTLYGVSVGPGDPELMTLKAVGRIARCPVLAVPRTAGNKTLALDIAARAVDVSGKEIVYLDFAMTRDPDTLAAIHRGLAGQIAEYLDAGQDVAMLSLGDASLYSSYSYLCQILLDSGYTAETIPGVTSFCACAAALNRSLTEMDFPLFILPASAPNLPALLSQPGGKVIMKSGKSLRAVKALLREQGLSDKAALVTDCGLPTERAFPDIDAADGTGYFTTVLIAP